MHKKLHKKLLKKEVLRTIPACDRYIRKGLFAYCFLVVFAFISSNAHAEACTYNDALLSLKQGNQTRGMALLTMAANDGDQRAINALALQNVKKSAHLIAYKLSQN